MNRTTSIVRCALSVLALGTGATMAWALADEPVDFARDVAPIIQQHCIRCHQSGNRQGDLSLATGDDLVAHQYVVPGEPDESLLLMVVTPGGPDEPPQMPKEGAPLSRGDRCDSRWIARAPVGRRRRCRAVQADRSGGHQTVADATPPLPAGIPAAWSNPIDRFVYALRSVAGPSPPAANGP
jgi:hypothetical protein